MLAGGSGPQVTGPSYAGIPGASRGRGHTRSCACASARARSRLALPPRPRAAPWAWRAPSWNHAAGGRTGRGAHSRGHTTGAHAHRQIAQTAPCPTQAGRPAEPWRVSRPESGAAPGGRAGDRSLPLLARGWHPTSGCTGPRLQSQCATAKRRGRGVLGRRGVRGDRRLPAPAPGGWRGAAPNH